jgi:hypothetical protein
MPDRSADGHEPEHASTPANHRSQAHRLADAQNAEIWTAATMIDIASASAQIRRISRLRYPGGDHLT